MNDYKRFFEDKVMIDDFLEINLVIQYHIYFR